MSISEERLEPNHESIVKGLKDAYVKLGQSRLQG
jgi:hypothetical protein